MLLLGLAGLFWVLGANCGLLLPRLIVLFIVSGYKDVYVVAD